MQSFVVRIPEELARQVVAFLESGGKGYTSLSEFAAVALMNQLVTESDANAVSPGEIGIHGLGGGLGLLEPLGALGLELHKATPARDQALFVLTNRLSPIKMAARVLANLAAKHDGWPQLGAFQQEAGRVARNLGLRIRSEDEQAGHTGFGRRWVAYPVGKDERAATDRYIFSFAISAEGRAAGGPLAILGLATVEGDRASLTSAGWELASAPSPLLGEVEGHTISREEATILRASVLSAPAELVAVQEFVRLVRRAAGSQARLDELLAAAHAEWTADFAAAHRSAMLGRLRELGVLEVAGRGPKAKIELLDEAAEFETREPQEAQA